MTGTNVNRPGEPAYAGAGSTFVKVPLVLAPEDLVGADVAIVGAPVDETVSFRPGARCECGPLHRKPGLVCHLHGTQAVH